MPASTPRRGRSRAATPGPELQPIIYKLPPFWLGALCATFLILVGVSIVPNAGHVGVSGVEAKEQVVVKVPAKMASWWGGAADIAEHMKVRKACGLPEIDDFRCQDGVFMGENPVITDLDCEFTLTAIHNGESYNFDVFDVSKLFTATMEAFGGIFLEAKDGFEAANADFARMVKDYGRDDKPADLPVFYARWRKFVKPAATFSLRKGHALLNLGKSYHQKYPQRDLDMAQILVWEDGSMNQAQARLMRLVPRILTLSPVIPDPFSARLQYACDGDQPRLTFLPHDGGIFYGILMNLDTDFKLNEHNWLWKLTEVTTTKYCEGISCVYLWQASPPNTKKRPTMANPELRVVATLLDPNVNHKDEL